MQNLQCLFIHQPFHKMGEKTEKRAEVRSREVSKRSDERDFQSTSARALKLLWSPGPCLVLQGAESSLTRLKYSTLFQDIEVFIWHLHFYDSEGRSGSLASACSNTNYPEDFPPTWPIQEQYTKQRDQ